MKKTRLGLRRQWIMQSRSLQCASKFWRNYKCSQRLLSHKPVMASKLTAPLSGTLSYPSASLVDLGRLILIDYQTHLKAKEAAAEAAAETDDDEAMWEATHSLSDVSEIMWLLDRPRWLEEKKKTYGGSYPEFTGNAKEMEALNDPRQAEKSLLIMGINHKAEYVIPDAVRLRRETRVDPPEGGWQNEDALLDLLEFISKNDHSGLFRATEDEPKN